MSNPFLPKWEYIPDGEPRVFGDRVYSMVPTILLALMILRL